MIKATNLTFAYPECSAVLKGINLTISPGSHVAVMGKNGSGKTTIALLLKGILRPSSGNVVVDGFDAGKEDSRFEIMKRVGIVFQNPDDTIVATTVERELAFGLENTGVPPQEIQERVDEMLNRFDLETYRHTNPSHLSGGEKQRLALAAVMIMEPFHLILDEHGRFTQHGDLACDRLAHASQHNAPSIGIEVVNPYYPTHLEPRMAWSTVIDAPWAHKKKYVLPTPAQAEAVARFIEWVTSPASGLAIPRTWIGLVGSALAMGLVESAAKLRPGLYAHHYFGHADGAWLVLYAWLRLEAGLTPDVAFDEAMQRATGVRRRVDLSDLVTATAPKE